MKRLPTLKIENNNDLRAFIDFWSKLYSYPSQNLYNTIISKDKFDENDLQQLFIWKNGMKLSQRKQKSLNNKIKRKLALINSFKKDNDFNLVNFRDFFTDVSVVWKIFLLHIIKPNKYPIYDQHIHRTFNFIHRLDYRNISSKITDIEKEKFYFGTYLEFINKLSDCNLKTIDEAFFTFGKFLNTNGNAKLFE